jgi:hypothetical protein
MYKRLRASYSAQIVGRSYYNSHIHGVISLFSILRKKSSEALFGQTDYSTESGSDCKQDQEVILDESPTAEEIEEVINSLEREGLIEWRGEYRPARDGTLQKVWHIAKKTQLH